MNLNEIRNLPDGSPVPREFLCQIKVLKYPADGSKPAKVALTDGSVGSFATVIWRPSVPLQEGAWYEVIPGQDNQGREKVRVQAKTNPKTGKPYVELSIDGTAFLGPVEPPQGTQATAQGGNPPQGHRGPQGGGGAVQRQSRSAMTDREFVAWLTACGEEVSDAVRSWLGGDGVTPHGQAAVLTTTGSILMGMKIGAERGELELTYHKGEGSPYGEEPKGAPSGGPGDEDDIPFSVLLIPLLGALLGVA